MTRWKMEITCESLHGPFYRTRVPNLWYSCSQEYNLWALSRPRNSLKEDGEDEIGDEPEAEADGEGSAAPDGRASSRWVRCWKGCRRT